MFKKTVPLVLVLAVSLFAGCATVHQDVPDIQSLQLEELEKCSYIGMTQGYSGFGFTGAIDNINAYNIMRSEAEERGGNAIHVEWFLSGGGQARIYKCK